jgi:acyl-CoA reductase-like NAD-dependent aldehyde dehydrogenase
MKGLLVGPTLIDHVTPEMDSYHNEIFGPVLQIVRAPDFEAALAAAATNMATAWRSSPATAMPRANSPRG